MFGANKREKGFKDYCLILQVHPEADGAMVDAAYWHLARRYNQAASYDPNAREKLEELNEAYIVLGSPQRRDEYMKVRARVLGEGALPLEPGPAVSKPPLTVMARQRPAERVDEPVAPVEVSLRVGRMFSITALIIALAVAVLTIAVSPMLGLFAGLVFGAMLAGAALVLILPSVARKLLRQRKHESPAARQPGRDHDGTPFTGHRVARVSSAAVGADLENAESRTLAVVQPPRAPEAGERTSAEEPDESNEQPQGLTPDQIELIKKQAAAFRRAADATASDDMLHGASEIEQSHPEHGVAPLAPPEATHAEQPEQPQGLTRDQIDQIKKQTAAYRRAAQESASKDGSAPVGETRELDPAEAEKVRAQTERLKAIAEKFNAAKAKGAPHSPDQTLPS